MRKLFWAVLVSFSLLMPLVLSAGELEDARGETLYGQGVMMGITTGSYTDRSLYSIFASFPANSILHISGRVGISDNNKKHFAFTGAGFSLGSPPSDKYIRCYGGAEMNVYAQTNTTNKKYDTNVGIMGFGGAEFFISLESSIFIEFGGGHILGKHEFNDSIANSFFRGGLAFYY